jgi:hypothetical protein
MFSTTNYKATPETGVSKPDHLVGPLSEPGLISVEVGVSLARYFANAIFNAQLPDLSHYNLNLYAQPHYFSHLSMLSI